VSDRNSKVAVRVKLPTVNVQEGRVVEQGQHSELLEHQGVYAQMWNQQEFGSSTALTAFEPDVASVKDREA
jgi:hypothetical protein